MSDTMSRREFLRAAAAAGTAIPAVAAWSPARAANEAPKSPNEKLNLAIIGVAGRGAANLEAVAGENVVVLCDIDAGRLGGAAARFPNSKKYDDYSRVFEHQELDGVVVSTPDHMHAICLAQALRRNLPVYCEKPLTHSVYEARVVRKLAAESKSITQMGNQIHNDSSGNYRKVVERIRRGDIGPVERVHIWMQGVDHFVVGHRATENRVPPGINYDLWLGPAPFRPFDTSHFHFNWRYWWDFGGGQLADFTCHYIDLPYWALEWGYPTSVEATGEKGHDGDNDVPRRMKVDYHFPARGDKPPVHFTWYHGGYMPEGAEAYGKSTAVLFEGRDGRLLADYTTHKLFFAAGQEKELVEPSVPESPGQQGEWLACIRSGSPASCNFEYGGVLTEIGLLGNVSYRAGKKKLEWDGENMKATNCPEADQFLRREYREGWTL